MPFAERGAVSGASLLGFLSVLRPDWSYRKKLGPPPRTYFDKVLNLIGRVGNI